MNESNVVLIAIDGHGGSGKSTLANQLALDLHAEIVHIDDFTGEGASTEWYKSFIRSVIEPIYNGEAFLNYPRAKWWPEHDPDPVVNQQVTPILIIEGVCSLRKELRDYMDIKLFVDTPRKICIERGLERDRGMGGKSDDEIIAMWNQWLQWDDEYFAKDNPASVADVTFDGSNPIDNSHQIVMDLLISRRVAEYDH